VSARRFGALAALTLTVALTACSPGTGPLPVEPGPGGEPAPQGVSAECREAFPGLAGSGELDDAAHLVPQPWPDPPYGAELCAVVAPDDARATLHYVSLRQDVYAVLDYYQVALQDLTYAGWQLEIDESVGDAPTLTVAGPELEFEIRTDAATGTYVVDFAAVPSSEEP